MSVTRKWVWSVGGLKLTGESRSTGRKINLSPCQLVHHKSDNDWPDTEWLKKESFISDWAKHHDDVRGLEL